MQLAMHPVYFRYPDNRWTEAWMVEHYEFVRHGLLLPGEELPPRQLSTQEAIVKLEELSGLRPPARAPFIPRISKVFPAGAARNRTKRPAADRCAGCGSPTQGFPKSSQLAAAAGCVAASLQCEALLEIRCAGRPRRRRQSSAAHRQRRSRSACRRTSPS